MYFFHVEFITDLLHEALQALCLCWRAGLSQGQRQRLPHLDPGLVACRMSYCHDAHDGACLSPQLFVNQCRICLRIIAQVYAFWRLYIP